MTLLAIHCPLGVSANFFLNKSLTPIHIVAIPHLHHHNAARRASPTLFSPTNAGSKFYGTLHPQGVMRVSPSPRGIDKRPFRTNHFSPRSPTGDQLGLPWATLGAKERDCGSCIQVPVLEPFPMKLVSSMPPRHSVRFVGVIHIQ